MLVPPTEKFMEEVNDPLANDAKESVSEEVVQVIANYPNDQIQFNLIF